jgi:hypothetical protein
LIDWVAAWKAGFAPAGESGVRTIPTNFGLEDDSKIVATLPIAAPEIVRHEGGFWAAALDPDLDGIRATKLEFVPAR